MGNNWKIGSLFGIPFYLDSSWLMILALVTWVNAKEIVTLGLAVNQPLLANATGLIMALLLFGSVLLHELGHSLVARSQGIKVNSITLFLFGGVAAIERESYTPIGAFAIAIAGPAVSFALSALFFGVLSLTVSIPLLQHVIEDLARINLVLGIFNLIPGLPLDGGQVLKAIVWQITGNQIKGVKWAAASGKFLGWLAISLSLFSILLTGQLGAIWMGLIGWFILRNATAYEQMSNLQESLLTLSAADAMNREFRVVNAQLTLREFADTYLIKDGGTVPSYYAASDGRYRGLVQVAEIQTLDRGLWEQTRLQDIARPFDSVASINEKSSILQSILALDAIDDRLITVLSLSGAVAGTLDRGDIVAAIAKKLKLPIPEAEIKRIKEEGSYPPYLKLSQLAQTLKS